MSMTRVKQFVPDRLALELWIINFRLGFGVSGLGFWTMGELNGLYFIVYTTSQCAPWPRTFIILKIKREELKRRFTGL